MGRNLLKAPLGVLLLQAEDTRVHLEVMGPVRDRLAAVGVDVPAMRAELDAAILAGNAATLAVAAAEADLAQALRAQRQVNAVFRRWLEGLRLRLRRVPTPEAERAAALVRARLVLNPGRRFAATLSALRVLVPELKAQSGALGSARWSPDPLVEGDALLASAEAAALPFGPAMDVRRMRTEAAGQARERIQAVLRSLREAWRMARWADATLRPLPMTQLTEYADRASEGRAKVDAVSDDPVDGAR